MVSNMNKEMRVHISARGPSGIHFDCEYIVGVIISVFQIWRLDTLFWNKIFTPYLTIVRTV